MSAVAEWTKVPHWKEIELDLRFSSRSFCKHTCHNTPLVLRAARQRLIFLHARTYKNCRFAWKWMIRSRIWTPRPSRTRGNCGNSLTSTAMAISWKTFSPHSYWSHFLEILYLCQNPSQHASTMVGEGFEPVLSPLTSTGIRTHVSSTRSSQTTSYSRPLLGFLQFWEFRFQTLISCHGPIFRKADAKGN